MSQDQESQVDELLLNKQTILGSDEVGYGCLAGPLVVVGVRAPKDWKLAGLNDSKKLSPKKRDAMLLPIMNEVKNKKISYHLAERSNKQIDEKGVAFALKDAYVEVFHSLYQKDSLIIIDGILKFDNLGVDDYDKTSVIKADGKYPAVMAASIIAKCYRDDLMHKLHHQYPIYNWISNVGYPRPEHLDAIAKHGPCPLHRMSYAPMKNMKISDPRQLPLFDKQ